MFLVIHGRVRKPNSVIKKLYFVKIQGGPEKILLETIDSFVANSNFCEPPCTENLIELTKC